MKKISASVPRWSRLSVHQLVRAATQFSMMPVTQHDYCVICGVVVPEDDYRIEASGRSTELIPLPDGGFKIASSGDSGWRLLCARCGDTLQETRRRLRDQRWAEIVESTEIEDLGDVLGGPVMFPLTNLDDRGRELGGDQA